MPPYAPLASKLDQGVVWLGRTVSWCVPIMAVLVLFIVVLRYGFNTGAIAAQESVQYLHAAIFMLGAAVALQADQHVRVDIFYRRFSARQQAWVNGLGHVVFTLPLCGLIGWGSWDYVMDSWSAREASPEPGGLPFVYLLKTLIPVDGHASHPPGIDSYFSRSDRPATTRQHLMEGQLALTMFIVVCGVLLLGFPVALTLGGTALGFAALGILLGHFDPDYLTALTGRIFGTMSNETLVAVPLFILMGVVLERAKIAEDLLANMAGLFGERPGGLGVAVIVVGALLAASTGIVGATVVTMGVLALPTMLRAGYQPQLATGTICATGTLGQIIPPSIALVLLGDIMSSAYQQAQLRMNIINTDTVSVGDLFVGAMIPGVVLVLLYLAYVLARAALQPSIAPPAVVDKADTRATVVAVLPPLGLIVLVLGSILAGAATPTGGCRCRGHWRFAPGPGAGALTLDVMRDISRSTLYTTSMVFLILIGAAVFSLVFRGFGGDSLIENFFEELGGGPHMALLVVMLVMFLLGFILDFIEITFVVVPVVGPVLLSMGFDPIWLGVMIAVNLQTSFLTPPFGFALFYLRGVAPDSISTRAIYSGVLPFVLIQLLLLVIMWWWPNLVLWLPRLLGR